MDETMVEDILRANGMHESKCSLLKTAKAQQHTGVYLTPKPCDCWLSKKTKVT